MDKPTPDIELGFKALEDDHLRLYYKCGSKDDNKLVIKLIEAIEHFGYHFWGYIDGVKDGVPIRGLRFMIKNKLDPTDEPIRIVTYGCDKINKTFT